MQNDKKKTDCNLASVKERVNCRKLIKVINCELTGTSRGVRARVLEDRKTEIVAVDGDARRRRVH